MTRGTEGYIMALAYFHTDPAKPIKTCLYNDLFLGVVIGGIVFSQPFVRLDALELEISLP